jgi:hypothetical protein
MHLAASIRLQYWALDIFPPEQFDRKGLVVTSYAMETELMPVVKHVVLKKGAARQAMATATKAMPIAERGEL